MDYTEQFACGLELADTLIRQLGVHDPEVLRQAAAIAEARASSPLEFGVAAGYRIEAAAISDEFAELLERAN
jgi:hypothetical protein